uniref:SAP30 binding protein n=1 Tax=Ficedula albicollis TaxID=59894 RepID=A0A803VKQ9_FICAL
MAGGQHSRVLSSPAAHGQSVPWSSTGQEGGLVSPGYGEDGFTCLGGHEEGYKEEDGGNSRQSDGDSQTEKPEAGDLKEFREVEERDPQELVASFSERVQKMSPDEIKIPPEPPGRCSNQLKEGMDMNSIIQKKKAFRNPSIYEKLIQFCSTDEFGTNYPKDMFDPHSWSEDSYYEALAKAQKIEMDKWKKAKKECTKIEFVTGTKKGTTSAASTTTTTSSTSVGDAQRKRRRSKGHVTTSLSPTGLQPPFNGTATTTLATRVAGCILTVSLSQCFCPTAFKFPIKL